MLVTDHCTFISEEYLVQNTEPWHRFRKEGFGASEAAVLSGTNKWKSVLDLWAEKTGKATNDFVITPAIQHGIDTEPEAREMFTIATGLEMKPICAVSKQYPFCRASLDGINEDKTILLEIKCPSRLPIHMNTIRGTIPEYYYPQLQHQLFVTGAKLNCFWSYMQNIGGFMLEFTPNLPYIEELIKREEKLWDCVKNDNEPDPNHYLPMTPETSPQFFS